MGIWITGILVALCVVHSQQEHLGGVNDATKALIEARDRIRHTNTKEIFKNITDAIVGIMPKEIVRITPREFFVNIIHNVTNPENIRVFLRLVKESKMKKKGEIVRMTLKFMNPDNLQPEGLIRTIQSLDDITVSELTGIGLEYIKEMAPKILGTNYYMFEKLINLINPEDFKEIAKIIFDAIKDTNSNDLLWIIRTVKDETGGLVKLGNKYMAVDGEKIASDFQSKGARMLQDKARQYAHNIKRFANIEKISSYTVVLTRAIKKALVNLASASINDLQQELEKKNMTGFSLNSTALFNNISTFIHHATDFIDIDELGADIEKTLIYVKSLNKTTALDAEKSLLKYIPNVEDLIRIINSTSSLQAFNREEFFTMIRSLQKLKIPDPVLDIANGLILSTVNVIDEKLVRAVVEFIVKGSNIENKVQKTLKAILLKNIASYMEKYQVNLQVNSLDDLKSQVISLIKHINESMVNEVVHQTMDNLKHLEVNTVADMVTEVTSIANSAISEQWVDKILLNPKAVFEVVNKTVFSDFVSLNFNVIRLINETQVAFWCNNLASLAKDEFSKKVDDASAWIIMQFESVEDGHETAVILKLNDTTNFIAKFVKSMDLHQACDDVSSVLKLNRYISKEARQELINLMWSAFHKLQKATTGDMVNQQRIQNSQEILNALLRVLMRFNGSKPDMKTRTVRMAIRSVEDYSRTGKMHFRFLKNAREEEEERQIYDRLSHEILAEDEDEYDLSDTIIPYDPTVRYSFSKSSNTMLYTPQVNSAQSEMEADDFQTSTTDFSEETYSTIESTTKYYQENHRQRPTAHPMPVQRTEASKCANDIHEIVKGAWERHNWARRMFDGWLQLGTSNNTQHSGLAHRCLSSQHPTNKFAAKFCSANITMAFVWQGEIVSDVKTFSSGVCMPSSCNPSEFSTILTNIIQGSTMQMAIDPENCSTGKEITTHGTTQLIIAAILALILACTCYECVVSACPNDSNATKFSTALSLKTTCQQCFSKPESDNYFSVMYGVQALGMMWIVARGSLQSLISSDILSKTEVENNIWLTIPLNLYAATDVILFVGGALAALTYLKAKDDRGNHSIIATIITKLFTVVPCIAVMMLIRNGFFSNSAQSACNSTWWQHVLFIQNFMANDATCLPHGWYISLDVQLFLLTPLVLFVPITAQKVKWALSFIGSALMIVMPMMFLAENKDPLEPFPSSSNSQFQWDLVKPYTRLVPWVVGIVVGEILHSQNSSGTKLNISKRYSLSAMLCSLALLVSTVLPAKFFTYALRPHWQIAVYLGVSHLLIALALAVITIIACNNYGGWVRSVTSSAILNVLGRLAFCQYLVHMTIIQFKNDQTYAMYLDNYNTVNGLIGDYVVSLIAAITLSLLVQLPTVNICQIISQKYGSQLSKENLISNENETSIKITNDESLTK